MNNSGIKYQLADTLKINLNECYQCAKCTAGCPLSSEMDIPSNQILRMLQYGNKNMDDKIVRSYSIWLCLSCQTCFARCPQEIDLPTVMDYLRTQAIKQNTIHPKAHNIVAFHKNFLKSIKKNGRLHEAGFMMGYKMDTFSFFNDLKLIPALLKKGKLHFFPAALKGKRNVKEIFSRTERK